jgi:protoporphyrinogen oxidase
MSATSDRQRWGVVGGGMLGMTLALRLAQQGHDVTLFEGADQLGGLASAWQLGDVVWDRHYHVTLLSDTHLRRLLAELGLEQAIAWVETKTGCYMDGVLYSVSNIVEFLRFPPLRAIDKLRLGATIAYAAKISDYRRLEDLDVCRWLRRWSGRRTFERFWLPLLRAKLGENYRDTSAAFIWAVIQRLYAARRTGLKTERFGYVPGGYQRILARFADVLARLADVRLASVVERVAWSESHVRVQLRGGVQDAFDRVVVTAAAPIAARLIAGLTPREQALLAGVAYQGIVCASVLLERPLAGYYITNIIDDWVPFTAVIEMSALVDPSEFGGRGLVYLPRYVVDNDPLLKVGDGQIERCFLSALERMYPGFRAEQALAFRVSRVRYVLPLPRLGYSRHSPPMTTSVPGVYVVNSAQIINGTLNVNETVQLAERAARMLGSVSAHAASVGAAAEHLG